MTTKPSGTTAAKVLGNYRFGRHPIYVVGSFDVGVTVLSQQMRALNLAWALTAPDLLTGSPAGLATAGTGGTRPKVAVVGGGFAGLSVAAGLLRRDAGIDLTIFEQRDTLLPLQHGSDTRWLHPRIYDWPAEGSEAGAAMLPVLNWTAARASDVVVQVLKAWGEVVREYLDGPAGGDLRLFCNARHIQVFGSPNCPRVGIEWVGERRDVADATFRAGEGSAGSTELFDAVILAVGFGLERDEVTSYWRNDVTGQPSLDRPRRTYLVSGQGDGAMIDLLRLRISHYRQDRILGEIFRDAPTLLRETRRLYEECHTTGSAAMFDRLEAMTSMPELSTEFDGVRNELTRRLRRDSDAVLHLKLRRLSELFDPMKARISFQNKFMVYLLYKCGGFVPSTMPEEVLTKQHFIEAGDVIRRHGTYRNEQFERLLSERLALELRARRGQAVPDPMSQPDEPMWPGGYFALGSTRQDAKGYWRKEYLPTPTELLGLAFCSAVAGFLAIRHGPEHRLRVTLHRTMQVGGEELLQQCCEYAGVNVGADRKVVGRTFPAGNATIGAAYRTRRIVRSREDVSADVLQAAMRDTRLNEASRDMRPEVDFLLAVPLLEPETAKGFTKPSPVAGVLYVDSTQPHYRLDDTQLRELVGMCCMLARSLERTSSLEGIVNIPSTGLGEVAGAPGALGEADAGLETVDAVDPPRFSMAFQFNFDGADFVPVGS